MEFRYRAGEENPFPYYPQGRDGYFTSQPLRGLRESSHPLRGLLYIQCICVLKFAFHCIPFFSATQVTGGDLGRDDSLPQTHVPCPSSRDALRRELEKERIREEIIAREILLRRELEEEVRRELAVERELALRRQGDRFAFASSSTLLPTTPLLAHRGATLLPYVDSLIGERPLIGSCRSLEGGCFGRLPAELQPDPTVTEIKTVNEIDKVRIVG